LLAEFELGGDQGHSAGLADGAPLVRVSTLRPAPSHFVLKRAEAFGVCRKMFPVNAMPRQIAGALSQVRVLPQEITVFGRERRPATRLL